MSQLLKAYERALISRQPQEILEVCRLLIERTEGTTLPFPRGDHTPSELRLKKAILDVIDSGPLDPDVDSLQWHFYEEPPHASSSNWRTEDMANADRLDFADGVIHRARELEDEVIGQSGRVVLEAIRARHAAWRAFCCSAENMPVFERQAQQMHTDIGSLLAIILGGAQ